TASGEIAINPVEFTAGPAAGQGQTWHAGIFVQLVAGILPAQARLGIFERDAANTLLDTSFADLAPGATLAHGSVSRTLSSAAAARVTSSVRVVLVSGQSCDFTLALGPSGLSQSAFTSTILTLGTAGTRAADSAELL